MANDIVWYDSNETGAPTLNNAVGASSAVIALLDACLITGFRSQTLTSVVVASNVATATLSGHGYYDQRMVDIAGAGTSAINGRKLITVTGTNTFTFSAPGVSDGTITGTITAKRSPLGWAKPASGTGKAIYQRSDGAASTQILRVDDQNATYASFMLLESYSTIDVYVSPLSSYYLSKGANSGTAKRWVLVGDSRSFYLFTEGNSSAYATYGGLEAHAFGDILSFRSGDAYPSFLAAMGSTAQGVSNVLVRNFATNGTSNTVAGGLLAVARPSSQLSGAVNLWPLGVSGAPGNTGVHVGASDLAGPTYPSPVDNGLVMQYPVMVAEGNSTFINPVRGIMPGLAFPIGRIGTSLRDQVLSGLTGTDRKFLCIATLNQTSAAGCIMLDITGPWQ